MIDNDWGSWHASTDALRASYSNRDCRGPSAPLSTTELAVVEPGPGTRYSTCGTMHTIDFYVKRLGSDTSPCAKLMI